MYWSVDASVNQDEVPASSASASATSLSRRPSLDTSDGGSAVTKTRIRHACDRCRLTRSKCSGGLRCDKCTKEELVCLYGDHKRERSRKELAQSSNRVKALESENQVLVATLRRLMNSSDFDPAKYPHVVNLIVKYGKGATQQSTSSSIIQWETNNEAPTNDATARGEEAGEGSVACSVRSPERQGELFKTVDLGNGAGAVGFVGKMSAISWIQRCFEHSLEPTDTFAHQANTPESNQHANFAEASRCFTDDEDLLGVDEDHVNALHRPSFETAVALSEAFSQGMQSAFTNFSAEEFLISFSELPLDDAEVSLLQRRWLAHANLVWAIGAKWLHLVKSKGSEMIDGHLVYYARARALGLDHRLLYDHPDEEVVAEMGLLASYLLINGSITRAWNTLGNAIRHGTTLGLHLKLSDPSVGESQRRERAQTWFSMYRLQMLMVEIVGRPQLIRPAEITLPLRLLEEQPPERPQSDSLNARSNISVKRVHMWRRFLAFNNATLPNTDEPDLDGADLHVFKLRSRPGLFIHSLKLSRLSAEIADQLYTGLQEMPWIETQSKINQLQGKLSAWESNLPSALKIDRIRYTHHTSQDLNHLVIYYYSVTMMIHRPCLCQIKIPHESQHSRLFNISSAQVCVNAGFSMLEFLPIDITAKTVYCLLPWWALLHYVCQAAAILLLELFLDAQHVQDNHELLFSGLDKAMSYLAFMAQQSRSAYRAWRAFNELIERLVSQHGDMETLKLTRHVIQPATWTSAEEDELTTKLTIR